MNRSVFSLSGRAVSRALSITSVAASLLVAAGSAPGQTYVVFEKFNEAGTAWSDTVFSSTLQPVTGIFERGQTAAGLGAPNTIPGLPVNESGDKEGRFFVTVAGTGNAYAFTPSTFANRITDGLVDGYISLGVLSLSGLRSAGLMLRTDQDGGVVNGYIAMITHDANGDGSLRIARVRDDIVELSLASSEVIIPMTTGSENYHLYFSANGPELEARLARVEIVGGDVRETRVDLLSAAGTQDTITAIDTELLSGFVGLRVFTSGTVDNSIFFDDVDIVERACDNIVNVESQALTSSWGMAAGNSPGDIAFTEDAIPVRVFDFFQVGGGTSFGIASVERTVEQIGFGRVLQLNNINAGFNFSALGRAGRVCIEFGDLGGHENLVVNNSPVYIGEISAVPSNFAPGITATVSTTNTSGGIRGVLTLEGSIYNVRIGGQEFFIDDICAAVTCACDWNADFFLNSQDFFDFLVSFFGGDADYNLDGVTNSQDYFDFLTCFFSGCV
ncbi:MAG: hypothetical protein H7210_09550 [Pyrinomonadaceae bacterium]|nr:hypothetical protein [Phycisphaerales bacterium]